MSANHLNRWLRSRCLSGVALFFAGLAAVRLRRHAPAGAARLAAVVVAVALLAIATRIPSVLTVALLAVVAAAAAAFSPRTSSPRIAGPTEHVPGT